MSYWQRRAQIPSSDKSEKKVEEPEKKVEEPEKKDKSDNKNQKGLLEVDSDIVENTTWDSNVLITAEVHVRLGVKLVIKPGCKVFFRQGCVCNLAPGGLPYASLVVDSGASLDAQNIEFRAENNGPNTTGGVFILGTASNQDFPDGFQFEDYPTVKSDPDVDPGHSKLFNCSFVALGNNDADINALNFIALQGVSELQLSKLSIINSGDDGLEIFLSPGTPYANDTNQSPPGLFIDDLTILDSLDDALDLDQNSTLTVTNSLTLRGPIYPEISDVPSLLEVTGMAGTVNAVVLQDEAVYYLGGLTSDKTAVEFFGSWTPLSPQQAVFFQGVAATGGAGKPTRAFSNN